MMKLPNRIDSLEEQIKQESSFQHLMDLLEIHEERQKLARIYELWYEISLIKVPLVTTGHALTTVSNNPHVLKSK